MVLAAARVGGIVANSTYPADFVSDNLRIQVNVLDAAARSGTERLLFLGSSCIYPKFARQPIDERSLLGGPLEPTNDAYAIAKIAGILHVQALRRQHGVKFISAIPTNLFGQHDNFNLETAHVIPAMIRRMYEAREASKPSVVLWGTGSPRREFLHVDDFAEGALFLLENYDDALPLNVGSGKDISIRQLAELIRGLLKFPGSLEWDESRPDGTPQKLLDVSRLTAMGWRSKITLQAGLEETCRWWDEHAREARGLGPGPRPGPSSSGAPSATASSDFYSLPTD